jgi:glycerol-3-phosphate dehydrogenase
LRPLITDAKAKDTTAVSRKEELIETRDGLISIGGGKLTTYRLMAEQGINVVLKRLGRKVSAKTTADIPISGAGLSRAELEKVAQQLARTESLSVKTAKHLGFTYGSNYTKLVDLMHEDERLCEPLTDDLPHIKAEVVYAARAEMALTLADVLTRRTRLAILAGEETLVVAPVVADLMAKELSWNKEEISRQIALFAAEFNCEYSFTNGSDRNQAAIAP